jgi:hypothetical protein
MRSKENKFQYSIKLDISAHHKDFLHLVVRYIYYEYEQGNNTKSSIKHYNEDIYWYYSSKIILTYKGFKPKWELCSYYSLSLLQADKKNHCSKLTQISIIQKNRWMNFNYHAGPSFVSRQTNTSDGCKRFTKYVAQHMWSCSTDVHIFLLSSFPISQYGTYEWQRERFFILIRAPDKFYGISVIPVKCPLGPQSLFSIYLLQFIIISTSHFTLKTFTVDTVLLNKG